MIWRRDCRAYSRIGARNDFPVHEKRGSASYQAEDGRVGIGHRYADPER